ILHENETNCNERKGFPSIFSRYHGKTVTIFSSKKALPQGKTAPSGFLFEAVLFCYFSPGPLLSKSRRKIFFCFFRKRTVIIPWKQSVFMSFFLFPAALAVSRMVDLAVHFQTYSSFSILTAELVPILSHPASKNISRSSLVFTPPAAFIFTFGPILAANRRISSMVAPPVPNPVDVLM